MSPHRESSAATDEATAYVRRKRIALAKEISPKKKIYLDTKYWVLFRDVRLKRPTPDAVIKLHDRLAELVSEGRAICPLNADVFFEVFKQSDRGTLRANVELLDSLSNGVSIIPMTERVQVEAYHFVESQRRGAESVHKLAELVWSKAAYIIGFVTPDCHNLTDELNLEVQKRFADHMWSLGLIDYLDLIEANNATPKTFAFEDISSQLNQGKFENLDEHKSFRALFLSEVRGILDAYKSDFRSLIQHIFEQDTGNVMSERDKNSDQPGRLMSNLIFHAFQLNRITDQFPTIRISAGLHAALRWDRKRKYKRNDLFDFRHAEAALPYCDIFLTEHSLRTLLQHQNLNFERQFPCKVYSDPDDALRAIAALN